MNNIKNFKSFNESNKQGNVKTYGGLKAMINSIIKKQKLNAVKSGAVNILIDQACGLIPGLSNIKTGFDFFKSIYNADDTKKTNTWIDKLNIDDDFSAIVDNSIENQFIKNLYEMINKKPDNENLPDDFDINKQLTEFLSKKYNNRTLTGVSEQFINQNILIDKNYVNNFFNDFGFLITLNFSQITKMGIDQNSTNELITMMSNLRKPIINGLNYIELTKDTNELYNKPRLLSELLNKIREFLIYIEPRIKKFVKEGEYKTKWLEKINDLKERYKYIISNQ